MNNAHDNSHNLDTINHSCYDVVDSVDINGDQVTVETSYQAFGEHEGPGWTQRETVTFERDRSISLDDQVSDEVDDALCLFRWGGDGDAERQAERRAMACDL